MAYELFPHQVQGAAFLTEKPGTRGLFHGMGTGKTRTALEGLNQIALAGGGLPRAVIIGPPISLPMWFDETEAYFDQPYTIAPDVQLLSTGKTAVSKHTSVIVVSYAIAAKRAMELHQWLKADSESVLICDESHALKNSKAKRTQAILGSGGIASGAEYSWMLTGTPITRWNDDMYSFLCNADLAGFKAWCGGTALERFQQIFTIRQLRKFPGARFPVKMVIGNQNTDTLADWVYGTGLAQRVDLEEVFKSMPPLTTNRYEIKLETTPELRAMMKEIDNLSLADIQQKLKMKEPALASIRRQIGMAKVKAAAIEIAERIESGQNVLVGAWHTDVIDALQQEIQGNRGYSCASLDGRSSITQKRQMEERWNAGDIQCFIGQIAAMGVSLNLQQGGSQIIVVEEDWSPSIMDQFYARLWRYGQEKHVHVDVLVGADNKLEKALGRINRTKENEHHKFNEAGRKLNEETAA